MDDVPQICILVLVIFTKCVDGVDYHLIKLKQKRLDVPYNTEKMAENAIQCNALCKMDTTCMSLSYNKGTRQCRFSEICAPDVMGNTVVDPDWNVYTLNINDNRECGCNYNQITGSIISPNYPDTYSPDLLCTWTITAPYDRRVALTFSDMSVGDDSDCNFDALQVFDGYSDRYPLLGEFCGTSPPGPINSCKSNIMSMKFKTNMSYQSSGFKVTWSFQNATECGCTYYNVKTGTITSPNYPGNYTHGHNCLWVLTSPTGSVTLTFTDFDLELHVTCGYDYVELQDAHGTSMGTFCEHPISQYASTGSMNIIFHTDDSITRKGFRATWSM